MIARRALNQGVQVQGGLACLPTGTAPTDPEQQHAIDFLYETICPLPIHLAHAQRLGYDVLARATAIDLVWAGKGALAKEWIAPDKAEPAYNRALLFCPDDEREAATAYAKALRVDTQEEGSAGSEGMGDAQPWLRVDPQGGSGAKRPKPAGSDRGAAGGPAYGGEIGAGVDPRGGDGNGGGAHGVPPRRGPVPPSLCLHLGATGVAGRSSSSSSSSSSTSQSQQQFTSPTSTPLAQATLQATQHVVQQAMQQRRGESGRIWCEAAKTSGVRQRGGGGQQQQQQQQQHVAVAAAVHQPDEHPAQQATLQATQHVVQQAMQQRRGESREV